MVVAEGPAAEALVTFITETVPPAVDAELVCVKEVAKSKETCRGQFMQHIINNYLCISEGLPVVVGAF